MIGEKIGERLGGDCGANMKEGSGSDRGANMKEGSALRLLAREFFDTQFA